MHFFSLESFIDSNLAQLSNTSMALIRFQITQIPPQQQGSTYVTLRQLLSWQLLDTGRDKMIIFLPLVLGERCHFAFNLFLVLKTSGSGT